MYKTILVPHAGTPAGDEALKHAIHAAKGTSAKIILLHVVEEIQHPMTFGLAESERNQLLSGIRDANESIRKEMGKEMEKRIAKCKESNVTCEVRVQVGDAAEKILDAVANDNVDLIVMAKRRKLKGMKKLFSLGSVSRKIVENVTCPVNLIDIESLK
ncbi:MAG: universal stress protein [Crenarchaeota archaeon]|nr:MAG: universal stress protein [Thermoproteota archaeon]RDJ34340.1 MAG: universal stress protein [Thermoproteota archaeon]RDJ36939.1 MAG: universal stress protein [Thermoproteota archaeon]RDJ37526.1 MAG: universal stress protein [Thermoproteota archaeon]